MEKTEYIERFHKLTVKREFDMVRMKQEINELLVKPGRKKRYKSNDKELNVDNEEQITKERRMGSADRRTRNEDRRELLND